MKRTFFLLMVAIVGVLLVVSVIRVVEIAIGGYLFAGIMLLESCFAPKKVRGNNSLKLYFQSIGKWKIYRNICVVLSIVFIIFSTIALLSSM